MRGSLFVISAPSGAGKTTLAESLTKKLQRLVFSVSFTTRASRPGEVSGKDYRFTSEEEFRRKIDAGEFLEWAEVHGSYYGTSRAETEKLLDEGYDVLLDIDVQGAAQVREASIDSVSVLILPPDYETLRTRLLKRGTEDAATLERRLTNAAVEVGRYREFDYVVVNEDRVLASEELVSIFRAERSRTERQEARVRGIVDTFPAD